MGISFCTLRAHEVSETLLNLLPLPLKNRSTLKLMNLLPWQAQILFLELSHFQIKFDVVKGKQEDTKNVSFVHNDSESTQCIHSPQLHYSRHIILKKKKKKKKQKKMPTHGVYEQRISRSVCVSSVYVSTQRNQDVSFYQI